MKIIIHTAGGSDIGIGHLVRAHAVAKECEAGGFDVSVIAEMPDEARLRSLLPKNHIIGGIEEVGKLRSDLVITDRPGLTAADSSFLRTQGNVFLAHITDYGRDRFIADLYLDTDQVTQILFANPKANVLRGYKYTVISDKVKNARPGRAHCPAKVGQVLVALGGADPGELTETFCSAFDWRRLGIQLTAIAGPGWKPDRLKRFKRVAPDNCTIVYDPGDVTPLMLDADLVVTLGGIMSFEAMCLGRTVAALNWRYMGEYVNKFSAQGLLFDLGREISDWKACFPDLLGDTSAREQITFRGFNTIDGGAVSRLVEAIMLAHKSASHSQDVN